MALTLDKNLSVKFNDILEDGEKIHWVGKPKLPPYLIRSLGISLPFIAFGIGWIYFNSTFHNDEFLFGKIIVLGGGILTLLMGIYRVVKRFICYGKLLYAFTNKKVIIRPGFLANKFIKLPYEHIATIKSRAGFLDRYFQVGSIWFDAGKTKNTEDGRVKVYDKWESIPDYLEVLEVVKKANENDDTNLDNSNFMKPRVNLG